MFDKSKVKLQELSRKGNVVRYSAQYGDNAPKELEIILTDDELELSLDELIDEAHRLMVLLYSGVRVSNN